MQSWQIGFPGFAGKMLFERPKSPRRGSSLRRGFFVGQSDWFSVCGMSLGSGVSPELEPASRAISARLLSHGLSRERGDAAQGAFVLRD